MVSSTTNELNTVQKQMNITSIKGSTQVGPVKSKAQQDSRASIREAVPFIEDNIPSFMENESLH